MFFKRLFLGLGIAAAIAGCSTIESAKEAQRKVAPKGSDAAAWVKPQIVKISDKTLGDLVDLALTNRPSMAMKRLAVTDARLALKVLAADAPIVSTTPWTVPNVTLQGGYNALSDSDAWHDFRPKTYGDPSAGISLSLLLYDFGRYDAQATSAREAVVASEQELVQAGYEVFSEVSTAYFTFIEDIALLDVAITNEEQYAAHLEEADGRVQAGEAKMLDLLKARLDLANAREGTVSASNAAVCAGVELVRVLGFENGAITTDDLAALAANALDDPHHAFAPTTVTAEELYVFARTNAPAMRVARAQLRAAQADVDAAIADLYPKITASTGVSWADPFWTWTWGVNAVQTLFAGLSKVTTVDRKVVALKQAAANVDKLEHQYSSDIATAISVRDNARLAIATSENALKESKENLDTVREEYAIGEATRIDYTSAVSSYVTELGNHIQACYYAEMAEAALFKLAGTRPAYQEETTK